MTEEWLIEHATIVTMNESRDILFDASIVIKDDRIVTISERQDLNESFPQAKRLDIYSRDGIG